MLGSPERPLYVIRFEPAERSRAPLVLQQLLLAQAISKGAAGGQGRQLRAPGTCNRQRRLQADGLLSEIFPAVGGPVPRG